jgi:hypothetical protein
MQVLGTRDRARWRPGSFIDSVCVHATRDPSGDGMAASTVLNCSENSGVQATGACANSGPQKDRAQPYSAHMRPNMSQDMGEFNCTRRIYPKSFFPKGRHRVDPGGVHRGEGGGEKGDEHQDRDRARQSYGIARTDAE